MTGHRANRVFAIKTAVADLGAGTFDFPGQKTMYGGKLIAAGDTIFLFDSENEGGSGLFACGIVARAQPVARIPGIDRQTPRVDIAIERTALASRRLGRTELVAFQDGLGGGPEAELQFKFYRQATNKIVGLSEEAAAFLRRHFP